MILTKNIIIIINYIIRLDNFEQAGKLPCRNQGSDH